MIKKFGETIDFLPRLIDNIEAIEEVYVLFHCYRFSIPIREVTFDFCQRNN